MAAVDPTVFEYEVFKNEKNALAFFFGRHPVLDKNPVAGPFWFTLKNKRITAGTGAFHVIFEDVQPDIIDIAKKRGVIMLTEFENQQPVRCTPCYLAETF